VAEEEEEEEQQQQQQHEEEEEEQEQGLAYRPGYSEDLSQCPSYTCIPPRQRASVLRVHHNDRNQPKPKNG
jgi:hypothetical protein